MNVERIFLEQETGPVPAVVVHAEQPSGAAVVVHGYGGCKEEQLGLAWRIAENGLTACAIDLRGHGENTAALDAGTVTDIETALRYCRRFGKVATVGHSLGGRIALLSSADFAVGISPALDTTFGGQTRMVLKAMRGHRVNEQQGNDIFSVLAGLPVWQPDPARPSMIVLSKKDVPEIMKASAALAAMGVPVVEIENSSHADIFLNEGTFAVVSKQLRTWYAGK